MRPITFLRTITVLSTALLIGACASLEGVAPTRATQIDVAGLQADQALADSTVVADGWPAHDWWTGFGDAQLNQLIDEALRDAPSMGIARARLDKTIALAANAGASLAPRVELSAESTRQRFSENGIFPPPIAGSTLTTSQAGIGFQYGIDLWGGNRAAYEAVVGQRTAAEVDASAAHLTLAIAVTRAYVQLQRAYEQLDIAEAARKQRESILTLTRQRVDAGLDSRLELKQSEAALPIADERAEQARETVALTRHLLAALLGQGPDRGLSIERPQLALDAAPSLPSVLPADLLGRRPDVIAQRLRVQAAQRDIDAAKTQFYPNINLSALAGVQSIDSSKLFDAGSAIPTLSAAIHLPLFDGGRLRANLAGRNADYDLAVEQYNQAVVEALRDVADQLVSLRSIDAQQQSMTSALGATEEGYRLAQIRYQGGIGNYLQVLTAETQLLEQRTFQVELRARKLDVSINLIRALGGGFDDKTVVGAAHPNQTGTNQTR